MPMDSSYLSCVNWEKVLLPAIRRLTVAGREQLRARPGSHGADRLCLSRAGHDEKSARSAVASMHHAS